MSRYYFWKAPTSGLPEYNSGGHGVTVIPGLGQFVLLNINVRLDVPPGAVPVEDVVAFLEGRSDAKAA